MTANLKWLAVETDGIVIVTSGARVASGDSGDQSLATLLGEASVVPMSCGILVDITVQGGTQASVDFDAELKYAAIYARVARKNVTPGSGVQSFFLFPNTDPNAQGGAWIQPAAQTFRLRWTFNTPGATPTITFSSLFVGWGLRNSNSGYPSWRP